MKRKFVPLWNIYFDSDSEQCLQFTQRQSTEYVLLWGNNVSFQTSLSATRVSKWVSSCTSYGGF
ncbi:hypothetical protein CANARDRAFT_27799 [[Candida] arabinofermentans NRRL YB-2248]|uniref:Uncharacterized protein n=1 Tax=[Candida] arabinofermentans NRRL YB-2248 TaxID=983967 RepID=A0A1E4T1X6_9ASCO|nr:hypothetical protein CANARDRAFT_27799 [[Candida] arabinofermentans NRRL YB-2248]